jgi:hypothetical protein
MDTYTINKAYHWTEDKELEITSENLIFIELCHGSGCQCVGEDQEQIRLLCHEIADIIRKIDELNKKQNANDQDENKQP